MSPPPTRAAVALATFGRPEMACSVLRGLTELTRPPDEIVVVDQPAGNGQYIEPEPDLIRAIKQAGIDLQIARQGRPNLPAARNVAVSLASSEVVLFVDDDVVLESEIVTEHLARYGQPEVAGVAGKILGDYAWPPTDLPEGTPVEHAIGCNMSFLRQAIVNAGGFDPRFSPCAFGEELELCLRLRHAGSVLLYAPAAVLRHLKTNSGGDRMRERESEYRRNYVRNMTVLSLRQRGWYGAANVLRHPDWFTSGQARHTLQGWWQAIREQRPARFLDDLPPHEVAVTVAAQT